MARPIQPMTQSLLKNSKEISIRVGKNLLSGVNLYQVVKQLSDMDWTDYKNNAEYKTNMKRRIENYTGTVVEWINDIEFLNSLIEHNVITGWQTIDMFNNVETFGNY